ncbi:hypothetical protein MASR2M78_10470 [Treponema sp.]
MNAKIETRNRAVEMITGINPGKGPLEGCQKPYFASPSTKNETANNAATIGII